MWATVKAAVAIDSSCLVPDKKGSYIAQTISHSTKDITVTTKLRLQYTMADSYRIILLHTFITIIGGLEELG